MLCLAVAAAALTRLNVASGVPGLNSEAASRPAERTGDTMILIVGAGLAGLSTAYHLRGVPYKILEREREVGGLCRSYVKDGFTFDYTGHLLHFRQMAIKALVESLLPTQLQRARTQVLCLLA